MAELSDDATKAATKRGPPSACSDAPGELTEIMRGHARGPQRRASRHRQLHQIRQSAKSKRPSSRSLKKLKAALADQILNEKRP